MDQEEAPAVAVVAAPVKRVPVRRPSPPRRDDGYEALVDTMADLQQQGVEISPVAHSLITQLYGAARAAEERADKLTGRYAQLQAEHSQLVAEFNGYCLDGSDKSGSDDSGSDKSDGNSDDDGEGEGGAVTAPALRPSGWQKRSADSLYDDMCRSTRSAVDASLEWRGRMESMFAEYMVMSTQMQALNKEMAALRLENEALRAAGDQ
ncbi:hypothetical protein GGR52DRAFT_211119 [Hypoxylon sp. FL1284]|nr:hypothetical protein GGR52DRAFT_211119 [Hypoxylon sp. FL1284]